MPVVYLFDIQLIVMIWLFSHRSLTYNNRSVLIQLIIVVIVMMPVAEACLTG
jgi:hypothetical protein